MQYEYQIVLWKKFNISHNIRSNYIVEVADHVLSVAVLPSKAGDSQSQGTDDEDINDNRDGIFKPTGQLKVEEEADESDEESSQGKRRRLDSRWLLELIFNQH